MPIWSNAPIDLVNKVYSIANFLVFFGSILAAVSTGAIIFWAAPIRERQTDLQLQAARRDAAQATERAAVANKQAQVAQAEQARLKVALEHEQVERLKFQGQFAWRTLSDKQRVTLLNDLSGSPGSITVQFVSSDPEATFLALQFERIFEQAGWHVDGSASTYAGSVFFGIYVPQSNQALTQTVRDAFTRAEIGFYVNDPPAPSITLGSPRAPANAAWLVIGSKLTPAIERAIQSIPPAQPSRNVTPNSN